MKKQTLALFAVTILILGGSVSAYMFLGGHIADISGSVSSPDITYTTVTFDLGALNSLQSFETASQTCDISLSGLNVEYVLVELIDMNESERALFDNIHIGIGASGGESPYTWTEYNILDLKADEKLVVLGDVYEFNMNVYGNTSIAPEDTNVYFSMTFNPTVVLDGQLEQYFRVTDNETGEPLNNSLVSVNVDTCTTDESGYCMMLLNHQQVYPCQVSQQSPYILKQLNVTVGAEPILVIGLDKET